MSMTSPLLLTNLSKSFHASSPSPAQSPSNQERLSVLKSRHLNLTIQQGTEELKSLLESYELGLMSAPYLPNTFQLGRRKTFTKLEQLLKRLPFDQKQHYMREFCEQTDAKLFPEFVKRIRQPYNALVYQKHYKVPEFLNMAEVKSLNAYTEFNALSKSTAEWLIQLEVANDLLARAQLYGFSASPNQSKLNHLQQLGSPVNMKKPSAKWTTGKLASTAALRLIQNISGVVSAKSYNNTETSWPTMMALAGLIVGGAAMPWTVLVSNASISYIASGYLFSKVLESAARYIKKEEVSKEILAFNSFMDEMVKQLQGYNEEIQKAITSCLHAGSEEELEECRQELEFKINRLVDCIANNNMAHSKGDEPKSLTEKSLELRILTAKESAEDQGWLVCDMQELEEVENVEDFVVCDVKK